MAWVTAADPEIKNLIIWVHETDVTHLTVAFEKLFQPDIYYWGKIELLDDDCISFDGVSEHKKFSFVVDEILHWDVKADPSEGG